jgi:pimeloyl-ACP methyl ester carboxylesterase
MKTSCSGAGANGRQRGQLYWRARRRDGRRSWAFNRRVRCPNPRSSSPKSGQTPYPFGHRTARRGTIKRPQRCVSGRIQQIRRPERARSMPFCISFFRPSPTSQAAGKAFWERRHRRKQDADRPSTPQTMAAQRAAIIAWSKSNGEPDAQPNNIIQPTLVLNGNQDIMIPTINSFNLSQRIPRAELIIYPDSGHGALFQFPELFVAHGTLFWTPQPDHKQRATWNASFESDDQGGSPHRVGRRLLRSRNEAAGRSGGGESHL